MKSKEPFSANTIVTIPEAAAWLKEKSIAEVSSAKATLPDGLNLKVSRGDDLATLKRHLLRTGAVLATASNAADVSRMMAKLRRGNPLLSLLPSAKAEDEKTNLDDALLNERTSSGLNASSGLDTSSDLNTSSDSVASPDLASTSDATPSAEEPAAVEKSVPEAQTASEAQTAPEAQEAPETQEASPAQEEQPAGEVPASAQEVPPAAPKAEKEYFFLLLIDTLENVPSLADLPGALPDLTIIAPIHACEEEVMESLRFAHGVANDTLWECHPDACWTDAVTSTLTASRAMLDARTVDAERAARLLLLRGHDGGYVHLLGQAVHTQYGLPLGKAMALVLPALRQTMEGASDAVVPYAPLRMRDLHLLAEKAVQVKHPMVRTLKQKDLELTMRQLYLHPEDRAVIEDLLPNQRAFFATGKTLDLSFRLRQLENLSHWMDDHEEDILFALKQDLNKCAFEAYETEILLVKSELKTMRKHLTRWARPRHVMMPLMHFPSTGRVYRDPYGLALIMSPWNYPFLLSVDPLLSAIAGGNCAVLKPSAYSPATSALLQKMVSDLFDPEYITVVEGGRAENQSLLKQKFDVIFFTGSPTVGKEVMKAAAEHLTPVTLELGGKSPCIVDDTADIDLAARRIAWGKFINAGQTCVAPDYILCSPKTAPKLAKALECAIRSFYGVDPLNNAELCRIVNARHFDRLLGLMENMNVACGGKSDRDDLKIEPTVLLDVTREDAVMQEEIFGPILPIVPFEGDFDALLADIESHPRPLAAYLFTRDKGHETKFLRYLRFGGGCINDVVCHLATDKMPFGGVGESGMGSYHGKRGFETFTHEKSVLKKGKLDVKVRYAPYGEKKMKLLKKM